MLRTALISAAIRTICAASDTQDSRPITVANSPTWSLAIFFLCASGLRKIEPGFAGNAPLR